MKHVWKMLMAALLACMLLVPMSAGAATMYGEAKQDDVPVMTAPETAGKAEFTIDKGYEFEIVQPVIEGGKTSWYKVWCVNPADGMTWEVYIRADYVQIGITPDGNEAENGGSVVPDTGKDEEDNDPVVPNPGTDQDDTVSGSTSVKGSVSNDTALYSVPSTSGNVLINIPAKGEVQVLSVTGSDTGRMWYVVAYNGKTGYVPVSMVDIVTDTNKEESTPTDKEETKPDDEKTEVVLPSLGTGVIQNTNGVNFRKGPATSYESMAKLKAGVKVEILSIPEKFDSSHWFMVRYDGKVGYIQAPYVKLPAELEDKEENTNKPTDEENEVLYQGVVVNTNGVNFRKGPDTKYDSMAQLPAGTKVGVIEVPEKFDSKHWFKVLYNGTVGYLQAPYVSVAGITDKPTDEPTDEPTTAPEDEPVKYLGLIINTNGLNFRKEADVESESMAQLKSGEIVEILADPIYDGKVRWYRVRYDNKIGYVQATYVYVPGLVLPDDEQTNPPAEEEDDVIAKGVIQNTNGVNFRKKADVSSESMGRLKAGVPVDILEIPEKIDTKHWFKVRYDEKIGYIQAPYVKVLAGDEEDEPTEAPTTTPEWDEDVVGIGMITSTNGVNLREGPSTHYDSLGQLSAGKTVQLLRIPSGTSSEYWFKIRVDGKEGYVQAPYVVVLQGEMPKDDQDDSDVLGIGQVTSTDGVNFRTGPNKNYSSMGKIPADTRVELLSIPASVGEDYWYKVRYNGHKGYVQSPFIRVVSINADALPAVDEYGYAKLLQSSANLRDSASGTTIVTWKGQGSLLRIVGKAVTSGYYEWLPVFYPADSAIYYVRADMVQVVKVEGGQIVTPSPAPSSRYGYVITTGSGVNLRIQPGEESIAQIPRGTVLVCVDDPIEPANSSYTWYEVLYNGMTGFVRGDYVRVCDQNGDPVENEDPDDPSDEEEIVIRGYIKLNTGNMVNLREKPAGSSMGLLPDGMILPVIAEKIPAGTNGQYSWYKVRTADGRIGYIRGDCVVECDQDGKPIVTEPEQTPEETATGYVQITGNKVYLRDKPFGIALTQMDTGTVWPIVGVNQVSNEITWYNIKVKVGTNMYKTGYVHGDYAYQLTKEQEAVYEATGKVPEITPEETPSVSSNHVITVNTNGLNLRESYSKDSTSRYKVPSGVVMEYIGTKQVGTVTWYNIIYKDIELWAHGDYLEVMTEAEYKAYLAENPDYIPDHQDFLGYVITTQGNVALLNAANGSKKLLTLPEGTIMNYYTDKIYAGGNYWYRVYMGQFGYVRADQVVKCNEKGESLVPDSTTGAPKSQQETSYSTLKQGSSGKAVTNLVNELINQGYYTGKVTSSFTSAVKEAVKAFQSAHGLDVDGIADSATQHALFGTVPIGAGDTTNLDFVIYPVEKIDWFDGGIQQLIPKGSNFKIYDVKTGKVWWAHRWSGAYHADIETLTKKDSKTLCEIYGVSNLQEIVDKNLWKRRPCLVTIGTRTFACSLDGMQHNPDGDTIGNNDMDGQICLHFTNSLGHSSGDVSESHSEAIQYAYTFDYSNREGYVGK